MKKTGLFVLLISLSTAANLCADDQTVSVQQELKDQGFYYGQVDGQAGAETSAAIRRYQIRNGLQVTGTLTQETLDTLKGAAVTRAAHSPGSNNSPVPPQPAPLDTQQAKQTSPSPDIAQSDREFLHKQDGAGSEVAVEPTPTPAPANPAPNVVPPPVTVQPPSPQSPPLAFQYSSLFARTPYQNAPPEVQQGTLRNAQIVLARQTYYNGEIDGIPGPATAHAILAFQANAGLAQTGRLDVETLGTLRLLPHQNPLPVQRRVIIQPFFPPPIYVQPRVYRGWAD